MHPTSLFGLKYYENIYFHKCCSHYLRVAIRNLNISEKSPLFRIPERLVIFELSTHSLIDLILESENGLFEIYENPVVFVFFCEKDLIPLANYFILRSNYRAWVINSSDENALSDISSGKKELSGEILTQKEYAALVLSIKGGHHNIDGVNPKTFYSRRYSALKKLKRKRISELYI